MNFADLLGQESLAKLKGVEETAKQNQLAAKTIEIFEDKYIYGTYIEMAFFNFYVNVEHIYKIVFGKTMMEEANSLYKAENSESTYDFNEDFANEKYIWQPFFNEVRNALPEQKLKIEELFQLHFPVLKVVHEVDETVTSVDALEKFSKVLRVLRNVYSHYKITLHQSQKEDYFNSEKFVIKILDTAFLGAKRIVKERFGFDNKKMLCAEKFLGKNKPNNDFQYHIETSQQALSKFGLLFLTSLFLEKKYIVIFSDKTKSIIFTDKKVITEILAVYRLRLFVEKLNVEKSTDALAMDMLNELKKCPQELYDHLDSQRQNEFRVATTDSDDEVLMVRYQDRFPQFVMRYIDEAELFRDIRFQLSLGNYFFKFYDKRCIDDPSNPRVRALSKHVNGFGRLKEINQARHAKWDDIIRTYENVHKNTNDESPYLTDHFPQYIVNGNRIAMRLFAEDEKKLFLPELTTEGVSNLEPSCWMSTYELPAMTFLIQLKGARYVENLIRQTVGNYHRLFADIASKRLLPHPDKNTLSETLQRNYSVRLADVPDDMADYLLGSHTDASEEFRQYALSLIDSMIEDSKHRLKRIREQEATVGTKDNKFGKKSYVTIQPGKLADFLAKDIMLFQSPEHKLTSLNFRILQSALALFSNPEQRKRLRSTFVQAHILSATPTDKDVHPIVSRVWNGNALPENVIAFYKHYLKAKISYLNWCRSTDLTQLPFLYANRSKWQPHNDGFYQAKANRYLTDSYKGTERQKAIELPRGLFEESIRSALKGKLGEMAADSSKNVSYLIYAYVKKMGDDCQPFYNYNRNYHLLDILYRKSPRQNHIYYSAQQMREALMSKSSTSLQKAIRQTAKADEMEKCLRLFAHLKDNETQLKRYRTQDFLLLMMAKTLLILDANDTIRKDAIEKIRLRDITNEEALSQRIDLSLCVESKRHYFKTIYKRNLSLKDYAKFYRALHDRRLPSLLDLVQNYEIDLELIENELEKYDGKHPAILQQAIAYEKDHQPRRPYVGNVFSATVKQDDSLSDSDKQVVTNIRNAFAHCSYPKYRRASSVQSTARKGGGNLKRI